MAAKSFWAWGLESEFRDRMTFVSTETGNRCSVSWMLARSIDDLKSKRVNSEIWTSQSWGQLGRSPDILAPFITALYKDRKILSAVNHPHCDFGENVINYHRYCRENDIFLTHALGDPQVDRSQQPQNEQRASLEEELALHVLIEEARECLKTQGIEPEFSEFEDRAFQDDLDIEILYNMALDGIEDTTVGDRMCYAHLQFDQWFEPFLNASTPVHPYAAEER